MKCKPQTSPMSTDYDLNMTTDPLSSAAQDNYRSYVGSLLYFATKSRADQRLVGSTLDSQVTSPTETKILVVKRALRYLQETQNVGLRLISGHDHQFSTHENANWGSASDENRRSWTEIKIRYENAIVFANSTHQKYVSLSSTETEYIVLFEGCRIIVCFRQILSELHCTQDRTVVYQDNNGAIEWATQGAGKWYLRRKHVDIRYHYVTDMIFNNEVKIQKTFNCLLGCRLSFQATCPAAFMRQHRTHEHADVTVHHHPSLERLRACNVRACSSAIGVSCCRRWRVYIAICYDRWETGRAQSPGEKRGRSKMLTVSAFH